MFTDNVKSKRGRPKGITSQGEAMKDELYRLALKSFAENGYEETTLRQIAKKAGVTAGLVYKYFPSKQAIALAFYNELSERYAEEALKMPSGKWRTRFMFSSRKSIEVLSRHRDALTALTPVLVGDPENGLFSTSLTTSRERVEEIFKIAARESSDSPSPKDAEALGRVLYVLHLTIILWWLLDKSPKQTTTFKLLSTIERALPVASLSLKVGSARKAIHTIEQLCTEGLFGLK